MKEPRTFAALVAMLPPEVRTPRLRLTPATAPLARAAVSDVDELGLLLRARIPDSWPPPLVDLQALEYTASALERDPRAAGWHIWYWIRQDEEVLIGTGGFKGLPAADGTVEIGYSVFEEFQRRGYATEAVGALIAWAFSQPQTSRVIAETYPDLLPSIRVMEKNGLTFIGPGSDVRIIRFELTRETYAQRSR